jgi:hypothetical protein
MNANYFTGFNGLDELVMFEEFVDSLPHGSGIDCTWGGHTTKHGKYVYFTNSYHVMNEVGYYVGYQDFTVRLDKKEFHLFLTYTELKRTQCIDEPDREDWTMIAHDTIDSILKSFTIQFNNGHYLADYYGLREYLEDTIYWSLKEWREAIDFI